MPPLGAFFFVHNIRNTVACCPLWGYIRRMHDEQLPKAPVTEYAIQKAASAITPDMAAAIRARMGIQPIVAPGTKTGGDRRADKDLPLLDKSPLAKAVNQEIKQTLQGQPPAFPTASVAAAVRAADVLLPEALEQRVLMIAGLYLNGTPAQGIAERLGLEVALVKSEIAKIDSARAIAYKEDPQLAIEVAKTEFDVIRNTISAIKTDQQILAMVEEEMRWDYQDGMNARNGAFNPLDDDDDEPSDENNTKKKPKRRPSISPMKLDSYFKGREVIGKQLDRLTDIFGLVQKHIPKDAVNHQQINNFVQFNNTALNDLANAFLNSTGNSIADVANQNHMNAPIIDVEGK